MQTNHVKLNSIKKSRTISVVVTTVAAAVVVVLAPPTEWKGRKTKKKKKKKRRIILQKSNWDDHDILSKPNKLKSFGVLLSPA